MKYLRIIKISLFLLFIFQMNLGYSQTKNDSLLCNIQDKIYSEFTTSFRANSILGLTTIDSLLKINKNDYFSLYWSSYCQYYQSLFFLKIGQRELSENKINSAILTLDTLNNKDSEAYALLAFLQSFSLQFRNSGDINDWTKKINYNGQKSIAINLVDRFNNNMENILWYDGRKILLSDANFSMQEPLNKTDWLIDTNDGILNCHFSPRGARTENINALIMKSKFTQPFGTVDGTIVIDGKEEKFTAFGVVEDHHAVW